MERYILTGGTMLLSVSVVYLISLWERRRAPHKSEKSEIDGLPTINIYMRDYIGNGQLSLKDRISASKKSETLSLYGKLRVVIPIDVKSSKISKPIPYD